MLNVKKYRIYKLVAIALVVILAFVIYLPATSISCAEESLNNLNKMTLADVLAGKISPYDYYGMLDVSVVPDAVGYETALERTHIERLYNEEGDNLYNAIFKNADGTKTEYIFPYPIKYVTKEGGIKDISLEIADSNIKQVAYETASSNIVTRFSTNLKNGINLSGKDVSVTLVPVIPHISASTQNYVESENENSAFALHSDDTSIFQATRIDNKTISYNYGEKTSIEYSLTYTGFKEDIVVNEYTGQTEYIFKLLTNGLALQKKDNSYYLINSKGEAITYGNECYSYYSIFKLINQ